ncbi:type 1 glutamine amidotransferase [Yinghuangia seranimata]|uniref:type 1 glutamine amidotransferase n=1 Tax=Yinghuangia seranimata TaxID=408067 RepID=UPI00248C4DC5|nr:type 1 glutamine amidotransferase [Yinghuangia seranimata]MDI2132729.1 type 1 glutamine amidotransferase [Yinghuangia seranimata]
MRALIIRHDHPSGSGFVGERLVERGFELTEVLVVPEERWNEPHQAVEFPDPRDFDVVVSLGAPWSVDSAEVARWVQGEHGELALLRTAVEADVPVLGVCFGGQALAVALGGTVERAPKPEVGWTHVSSDDTGLVGEGPWFQWHFDRFEPPPDAYEIARTGIASQAYVVGRSLGVQFHPEVTPEIVRSWLEWGGYAEARDLGVDPDDLLRVEPGAQVRSFALVDAFLDRIARI